VTGTWFAPGCKRICESTVSQEDADLCAVRQAIECTIDDPPGVDPGNPRPPNRKYYNTVQECTKGCGTGTVEAGTIVSYTQADADARAKGLACKRANARFCFLTPCPLPSAPIGKFMSDAFEVSGGVAPYTFAVTSGSLPVGTTLSSAGVLSGTPTTIEHAVFSVTATDSVGAMVTLACDVFTVGGLIGYWTYDTYSAGPDKLLDSTGNSHDLSILNPFNVVSGKVGNCMSTFYNQCETIADLSGFDNVGTSGFTICGWCKFDATQEGVIALWNCEWTGFYIGMSFSGQPSGPPTPGFVRMQSQAGSEVTATYPADGAWHFYRSWMDVSTGRLKLQIDMGTIYESASEVYPDSGCNRIKLQGSTTPIPDSLNQFDETGFWHRVLTDAEAAAIYNGGAGITWGNPAMP